jgi:hypothetical protein
MKKTIKQLSMTNSELASIRLDAVKIAAHLPESQPERLGGMMGGGYPGIPGKSADKVIADAEKMVAFILKR